MSVEARTQVMLSSDVSWLAIDRDHVVLGYDFLPIDVQTMNTDCSNHYVYSETGTHLGFSPYDSYPTFVLICGSLSNTGSVNWD